MLLELAVPSMVVADKVGKVMMAVAFADVAFAVPLLDGFDCAPLDTTLVIDVDVDDIDVDA